MRHPVFLTIAFAITSINAQPVNVFVEALTIGRSSRPIQAEGYLRPAIQAAQAKTGNAGAIEIVSWRISQFKQQAHCGRIGFALHQPASAHLFPELGGELNICDDGMPPLRICSSTGLVPASHKCPDGSVAADTAEVSEAVADASKRGGLTYEQVRQKLKSNKGDIK